MNNRPDSKVNQILSHRKGRSSGVYLKVLSDDNKQTCIVLGDALRIFPIVTYEYLKKYPDLHRYHHIYHRYSR